MPVNKEAFIRFRAINNVLQKGRFVTREELIHECSDAVGVEVAWRTIAGDLNAMRHDPALGFFAPIANVRNKGYHYTDSSYSIDQIPLQDEEITALLFAGKLLKQYQHVGIFSTFSGAVDKLNQNLSIQFRQKERAETASYISFEQNTADGGSSFIQELLDHIRLKTVISVDYYSFSSGKRKEQVIHPYYLKEYRNRWYVLGYHEEHKSLRTLALERIKGIEPRYDIEYRPSEIDLNEYYKHTIGVSVTDSKPQTIEMLVSQRDWLYLSTQPLHPSQKMLENSGEMVRLSLDVVVNYELKSQIMAMGKDVKVLKPESLCEEIRSTAKAILLSYDADH
ncbi:MAG: WYL domain-containing protein [Bacteroidetes bacterium]|nr:WYL domain-containing protein [Bacteroidota bacterium]